MTQVIDRTEEKVGIARELGLAGYIKTKERAAQDALIAKELTKMSFKPISDEEIEKKICHRVWDWGTIEVDSDAYAAWIGTPTIVLLTSMIITSSIQYWEGFKRTIFIGLPIYFLLLGLAFLSCYRRTKVKTIPICQWRDELPYGALLAMKEAREAGIAGMDGYDSPIDDPSRYQIHYPGYASSFDRVKADPVITGLYKGVQVEIFAWDDRKVYE